MKNKNLRYVKKSDKYYQKIELINGKEKKTRISKKEYNEKINKKGGWGLASMLPRIQNKQKGIQYGGSWGHQY